MSIQKEILRNIGISFIQRHLTSFEFRGIRNSKVHEVPRCVCRVVLGETHMRELIGITQNRRWRKGATIVTISSEIPAMSSPREVEGGVCGIGAPLFVGKHYIRLALLSFDVKV